MLKDIYAAVVVLMVAMPVALAIKTIRTGSLDKMYFWSTVFALVFGALTSVLQKPLLHLLEADGILLGDRAGFSGQLLDRRKANGAASF